MEQKVRLDIILWKNDESIKTPGKYPLKLQLYIDGKRSQQSIGFMLLPDQFNEDKQEVYNHPDAKFINAIARKKKRYYQDLIEKAMALDEEITGELIFGDKKEKKSFFEFCAEVRTDNVTPTMVSRIKSFWGKEPTFKDFTMDFMRKLDAWHKEMIPDKKNGGLKPRLHHNTLYNTGKYLRRIFDQAETEGYLKKNPFRKKYGGYKIAEYIEPERIFLVDPERDRFFNLFIRYKTLYSDNTVFDDKYKTLVYFMLACYTGFRHSDWCEFDPKTKVQEDNMIRLRAHKNKQWVVMPIGPTLTTIIEEIRRIGPFALDEGKANKFLRQLAPEADVDKDITTHKGRHTFGCHCATIGLDKKDTAYYMGIDVKTVEVYYHYTGEARKEQTKMLAAV